GRPGLRLCDYNNDAVVGPGGCLCPGLSLAGETQVQTQTLGRGVSRRIYQIRAIGRGFLMQQRTRRDTKVWQRVYTEMRTLYRRYYIAFERRQSRCDDGNLQLNIESARNQEEQGIRRACYYTAP
ncbi:hypothetical protein RB213_002496, partial [Colletotrichum asianum]